MRILGLEIRNFRGIRNAKVRFGERTLLVGDNNVGKTTIFEALDLVLGPERLRDVDVITEHDFYGSAYTGEVFAEKVSVDSQENSEPDREEKPPEPEIQITVLLGQLTKSERSRFVGHIRPPREAERDMVGDDIEIGTDSDKILPVALRAAYEAAEDEFAAQTFFLWPEPESPDEISEYCPFSRSHKRAVGFLYLRSLRTARRAATLQRNSLLDILLRLNDIRPTIWSALLENLATARVDLDKQPELKTVIQALRLRLGNYLPSLGGKLSHSRLQVGRLTRRDLRMQVAYFLETGVKDDHSLPFDLFGTGTVNLLVLALLRAIADAKQNVIFAMEEPEVALPPHVQRRVVRDVFGASGQAIFTSHSPYVTERFLDEEILVAGRAHGSLSFGYLTDARSRPDAVKPKKLRSDFRVRYAEGLLGRATLVVEGVSEVFAFQAVDVKLAESGSKAYLPTDLTGVVFVDGQGSELAKTVNFFRDLGIPTFAVWDKDLGSTPEAVSSSALGGDLPHNFRGLESLVAKEVPLERLQVYLRSSADLGRYNFNLPDIEANESEWINLAVTYWRKRKGEGDLSDFLTSLPLDLQPPSIILRLLEIWTAVSGGRLPFGDPLAKFVPSDRIDDLLEPEPDNTTSSNDDTEITHS